jgi:hypothetical protein
MPSKQDVLQRVLAAIQEKTGGQKSCSLCGHRQWTIPEGFARIQINGDPQANVLGGLALPSIPLTCTHCGNTHLLNLLVLGFTDLSLIKIDEDGAAKP